MSIKPQHPVWGTIKYKFRDCIIKNSNNDLKMYNFFLMAVIVYVCMLLWLCVCVCAHLRLFLPGFHYPLYGKTAGREESEVTPPSRGAVVSSKQSSDSSSSSAMELLQQQSHQYHGKSPAVRLCSLYCHNHTAAHSFTPLMLVLFTWN